MRILFLAHTFPYPPDDGMKSTCYALIKNVSKLHDAYLLCLAEGGAAPAGLTEMRRWCRRVEVVMHAPPRSAWRRLKNALFERVPFCVVQFRDEAFASRLRAMVAEEKIDVVHFLSVNISGYPDCLGATPSLFFPHDSVSMQFFRNAQKEPRWPRKLYWHAQAAKMKNYEKAALAGFSRTVVVSEVDREWIRRFAPRAEMVVIPGGVDGDDFKPLPVPEEPASLIFRGAMNFIPNIDAVRYFHARILPLLKPDFPDLKLYVVGKDPPPEIARLHDGRQVVVTGVVDDLRPYMAKSAVNVCPMRSGSGMKNKILEAWAMERAVVATTLACDGIDVSPGEDILVADDPENFAKYTAGLLRDPERRRLLGANGRKKALDRYSWTYVASRFDRVYRGMAAGKKSR